MCVGLRDHTFDDVLQKSGLFATIGEACVFYRLPTGEAVPRDVLFKDAHYVPPR